MRGCLAITQPWQLAPPRKLALTEGTRACARTQGGEGTPAADRLVDLPAAGEAAERGPMAPPDAGAAAACGARWVRRDTLLGLALGQFVSLLITATGFASSELARRGTTAAPH